MTTPGSTPPCIFVTGIWKSGNHLAYSALNELGIPGPFNGISGHLMFGRYAWLKRLMRRPRNAADAVQVGLETNVEVSQRYIAQQARKLSGCILGGHAAHSRELEILLRTAGARVICIRRDPRDILVSFADWIGSRPDFYLHRDFAPLSRADRVRLLLKGGPTSAGLLLPFTEILKRGAGWLDNPEVLQVSFEDLIGPAGGGDASAQSAALAAIHAHVNSTIALETVNAAAIYGGSLTFNKGRSQRWRELDDALLIQDIETMLASHLNQWLRAV